MIKNVHSIFVVLTICFGATLNSCNYEKNAPSNNDFTYIDEKNSSDQTGNSNDLNAPSITDTNSTKILVCDNFNTEVTGRLEEFIILGPPGFGKSPEIDKQSTGYKLILYQPVRVKCSSNDVSESVSTFQLQVENLEQSSQVVGSSVVVRGQIFAAHSPFHKFPYIVAVKRMESIKSTGAL